MWGSAPRLPMCSLNCPRAQGWVCAFAQALGGLAKNWHFTELSGKATRWCASVHPFTRKSWLHRKQGRGVENPEPRVLLVGTQSGAATTGGRVGLLKTLETELPPGPELPFLGLGPKEQKAATQTGVCAPTPQQPTGKRGPHGGTFLSLQTAGSSHTRYSLDET